MPGNSVIVTSFLKLSPRHIEQLRAIYLDSFPPYERADFSYLLNSIAQNQRWCFSVMQDDAMLGFAILVPHIVSDIHLLEYLAVSSNRRGRGIGGRLLDTVMTTLRLQSARGLFIEVEPDDEGTDEERQWRARRIRFYQQHGAHVVEGTANYRVPLTDRDGTMQMQLLWLPLAASARVPTGAQLRECIVNIYTQSYGLPREHPLIRAMLDTRIDAE